VIELCVYGSTKNSAVHNDEVKVLIRTDFRPELPYRAFALLGLELGIILL